MHTQQPHSFGDLPLFQSVTPVKPGSGLSRKSLHAPRFEKSVVDEAGLGRFVYLQGCSGRRYVFSAIKPEQIGLYENAVFAVGGMDGSPVELACNGAHLSVQNVQEAPEFAPNTPGFAQKEPVFVHLLAESDGKSEDVIADLSNGLQ